MGLGYGADLIQKELKVRVHSVVQVGHFEFYEAHHEKSPVGLSLLLMVVAQSEVYVVKQHFPSEVDEQQHASLFLE